MVEPVDDERDLEQDADQDQDEGDQGTAVVGPALQDASSERGLQVAAYAGDRSEMPGAESDGDPAR